MRASPLAFAVVTAAALELVKQKAVAETEKRLASPPWPKS